jgi:phosphoribosylglycinamide formyltransferase-1
MTKKIALLASGKGSNAKNISAFFKDSENISIELICSNNSASPLFDFCKKNNISSHLIEGATKDDFEKLLLLFKKSKINYIILCGFLLKVPYSIISKYKNKIINIHPSLLPKYGGKGMYGSRVHKAVILNNEKISGITIHFVNEEYDKGAVIFQKEYTLSFSETAESLAKAIQKLEHKYFSPVILQTINNDNL